MNYDCDTTKKALLLTLEYLKLSQLKEVANVLGVMPIKGCNKKQNWIDTIKGKAPSLTSDQIIKKKARNEYIKQWKVKRKEQERLALEAAEAARWEGHEELNAYCPCQQCTHDRRVEQLWCEEGFAEFVQTALPIEILGLQYEDFIDIPTIKKARNNLAKEWHPDNGTALLDKSIKTKVMQAINNAFEVLVAQFYVAA